MATDGKGEVIKINQKCISDLLSGKNFQDENFPVASFIIKKKIKKTIRLFYSFARMADDIADNNKISSKNKLMILNFFDDSIKNEKTSDISILNGLIDQNKKKKFSKQYSRNLLTAFKLDATKKRYKNWGELENYCKYSANPVGRFFINLTYSEKNKKLNNKYQIFSSSDNLCTALQIINHLQDCQEDFTKLNRVYLPISYFDKYGIKINILKEKKSSEKFDKLKKEVVSNVEKLLENLEQNLKKIEVWGLRKETLIILNIAKRLCFLLKRNDPLEKKIKLSRIDLIFCFIKGIILD